MKELTTKNLEVKDKFNYELNKTVDNVIKNNYKSVEEYQSGKEKLFGFFVGQVMKETGGKANPKIVNELLREKLKK